MNKNNIITLTSLLLFVFALISCGGNSSKFEVKGKLDNVTEGYFYAAREIGDSLLVDTVRINAKGEFSFSGTVDTLTFMSLYFNQNTKSTYILVDKGWTVELKGDVLFPDLISVKGGSINDDLTSFKEQNKDMLKSRVEILNVLSEAVEKDSVSGKSFAELKNINFTLSNIAANYVKANPDKIASVMLINTFFKDETSIPRLDENLELLRGEAALFPLTLDLKRYSAKIKQSTVGTPAPNFTLKDLEGKDVSLIDYRGKYLLLSFISTTCEACDSERKNAVEVYNQLKKDKKNIDFATIVMDTELEPISKNSLDSVKWTLLPDHGGWSAKTVEQYYIREIPYSILISPTGIILERDVSFLDLPKKLDDILSGKSK